MDVYVARKTFVHDGKRYAPGDVVEDFPGGWPRPDSALHTGLVVMAPPKPKPVRTRKVAS